MKNEVMTYPAPQTPIRVTTKRPGQPSMTVQGDYLGKGPIRFGRWNTDFEYVHLRCFERVDEKGNSRYRYEYVPLGNVIEVEELTYLDYRRHDESSQ